MNARVSKFYVADGTTKKMARKFLMFASMILPLPVFSPAPRSEADAMFRRGAARHVTSESTKRYIRLMINKAALLE